MKTSIELIKEAVKNAQNVKLSAEQEAFVQELNAELKAEELVIKHGLLEVNEQEIEQEFVSLDAVENDKDNDDFDNDENLTDMTQVSGSMREIFGE